MNRAASPRPVQQILDFGLGFGAGYGLAASGSLEQFVAQGEAGELAAGLVRRQAEGRGEPQLFLWGAPASGKTHLLQAACRWAGEQGLPAAYVSLRDAAHPGVLDGLENLALAALDDVQTVVGDAVWEEALFDLINRLRERDAPLLLAAAQPPGGLPVRLPDLASRLAWGPVLRLEVLDDAGKREVLRAHAAERGMELPDEVIHFMLAHLPRGLPSLLAGLDRLDRASMERQRRVTLPLAREVLG